MTTNILFTQEMLKIGMIFNPSKLYKRRCRMTIHLCTRMRKKGIFLLPVKKYHQAMLSSTSPMETILGMIT